MLTKLHGRRRRRRMLAPGAPMVRYVAASASGFLLAGAFPPADQGLLAWVALVPLLWAVRAAPPATAFRVGYLAGLIFFGTALIWIAQFGVAAWAALVAVMGLYIGGFAALVRHFQTRYPRWHLLLAPLVWTAVEIVRAWGPLGFPWALLGVSQHRLLPVLQLASIGGVYFVSLVVALSNALIFGLLFERGGATPRGLLFVALLVPLAGIAFGLWRMQVPLSPTARVAALQPNVPPLQKGAPQTQELQLRLMRDLTTRARNGGAEIVVFPETAIPSNLLGPGGLARELGAWAPDRIIVASSLEVDPANRFHNRAIAIAGDRVLGAYTKRRLVPFGEAGITPGTRADPIRTPAGTVGIAISYESAFPEVSRAAAHRGADLLAILTNDGWFGATAGPAQHAADAPVRAVETGRSVIRAANTGISMIVDPYGRVRQFLPLDTRGVIVGQAYAPMPTAYLRGGWLLAPAAVAVVALLAAAPLLGSRPWRMDPGFVQTMWALGGPGVIALAGTVLSHAAPAIGRWLVPTVLLVASAAAAGGWAGLSIRPRRSAASAILGLGVIGGLGATMVTAYARYGIPVQVAAPADGPIGLVNLLLNALAWEVWLRGAVFTAAQAWRGPTLAVIISTLPVLVTGRGSSQEVLLWSLLTNALFGLIRALTGDALGLSVARAAEQIFLDALP